MFLPAAFKETRREVIDDFLRAHPFATVVANAAHGLEASHVPVELIGGVLRSHVARGNALAQLDGSDVLVMFQGADAYISPNWYPSKQEAHREVPTWNYAAVHVHGKLRVIPDAAWLREFLHALTARHEADEAKPWSMADAPADYIDALLKGIVGIEVSIERIEAKFKFGQNKSEANRRGVIAGLQQRGRPMDAGVVESTAKTLSSPPQAGERKLLNPFTQ